MPKNDFKGYRKPFIQIHFNKLVVTTVIGIISLFIFIGMIVSFDSKNSLASSFVHKWSSQIDGKALIYLLGMENHYFTQLISENEVPNYSGVAFELMTSINLDDPRSLLGRELPGFSLFDSEIIIAGEGTDYTTLPIESAPPLEVLMEEREASFKSLEELDKQPETDTADPKMTTIGRKVVHILHSHSRESFLPELKDTKNPDHAFHPNVNITLVGERFGKALERYGIGVDVDKTDVEAILIDRGWSYSQSYQAGREIVQKAIEDNEDLEFFFEFHRDTLPRERTTVTINGKEYARTVFVIGRNHKNYEQNLKIASQLHELLEQQYPGLSRGIIAKGGTGTNGIFNQDLSTQSLLLEVGGIHNSLEEVFHTADVFAEVFSDYYWDEKS